MHLVVMEGLEDYLAGTLEPAGRRAIEAHLSTCGTCREEISSIQEMSALFSSLRSEETWDPSPGFYARVRERVGERATVPSFAGFFALDLVFGRRLVFVCLLTLAILGGYLVAHEAGYRAGPTPEGMMAQESSPDIDSASAQDNMLVTLTAYEH